MNCGTHTAAQEPERARLHLGHLPGEIAGGIRGFPCVIILPRKDDPVLGANGDSPFMDWGIARCYIGYNVILQELD